MKKIVFAICVLTVSTIAAAQSQFIRHEVTPKLLSWGFSAPNVTDKSQIVASKGDITIETVSGISTFYGYDGTNWKSFEAGSTLANSNVRSVTSTDTASNTDDVLILSGSSFTETLFSAVGNTGKVITVEHNGTSLTNAYTLNTTSAQTIGGVSSGSYVLYTNGEALKLVSDGTNWQILSHSTNTAVTAYTPTFVGVGTPGTTNILWQRQGANLILSGYFTSGTATATTFSMSLPASLTVANSLSAIGSSNLYVVGSAGSGSTQSQGKLVLATGGQTTINMSITNAASISPTKAQNGSSLFNAGDITTLYATIPIQGWQP